MRELGENEELRVNWAWLKLGATIEVKGKQNTFPLSHFFNAADK
jgi:hypothetical protein